MKLKVTCVIIRSVPEKQKIPEDFNLSAIIEQRLAAELVGILQIASQIAQKQRHNLYLVGGTVRDILLGTTSLDIDLVAEGDGISLAGILAEKLAARITIYSRFGTANIEFPGKWSIDLATARHESYARPGVLPSIRPGSISDDLLRRDFSINAMAVSLNPGNYGELLDFYHGRFDLEKRLIRVLHPKSFTDDATRIWRSLRYAERLDFILEENTLRLLQENIDMLDTISGDRIRYEVECILREECPGRIFNRAQEMGVLAKLHPSLRAGTWLTSKFNEARQVTSSGHPPAGLYLALMTYYLTSEEMERVISFLRLPKPLARILRDTNNLKLNSLADPNLNPSRIYQQLHGHSLLAIQAIRIAGDSLAARQNIDLFLKKLRYVKCALTGNDLKSMGIAPGPRMKEILQLLHDAKLEGRIKSREDEEKMVREWRGNEWIS